MIDINWLRSEYPELQQLDRLGRGGQKEVFSAVHGAHGLVVLKVFHVATDRERAVREVRAALELAGARVPRTYDLGTKNSPMGEVLWLIEERIDGTNLRDVLSKGPLPDADLLRLATDLLEILSAAEAQSIVHRDVKPENIIVAVDGSYWLIDFGLARHLTLDSLTQTGFPFGVGTPGYAPPEQFRNVKSEIDGRADLFGLGVTLFEAAEGVNPLRDGARDVAEILHRTENVPFPTLSRAIPSAADFSALVQALTRSRRSHRPDSVQYARDWLDDLLQK